MLANEKKIALVTASEMTVMAFLSGHLRALSERYNVTVLTNTDKPDLLARLGIEARVVPVAIARPIRPLADLRALLALWRIFRCERFDLVHSVTPKAGLLAMLAGKMAGVPVRCHIFTGQVWATRKGFMRWLLKSMDRVIANRATHVLADSRSQREFLIGEGVVNPERISVLADGSISGVDVGRFRPDAARRRELRSVLGIDERDMLFLFVGRLNRDKGVADLAAAFATLAGERANAHLLLVGPDEAGMRSDIERQCSACGTRVHFVDYTDAPERYMTAADVFCLPSYREGFGSVIIEAAACGVPAIGSRIYGITDAIAEGETGLLHTEGNVEELLACMRRLADDAALRREMGKAAHRRARERFAAEKVTQAWLDYYSALL